MTRLQPYERATLEGMPVSAPADKPSLRGLMRAEIQAGNIHGITGTQVVTMGKRECVAFLLGEQPRGDAREICSICSRPYGDHSGAGELCWLDTKFTPSQISSAPNRAENGSSGASAAPESDAGLVALAARLRPLLGGGEAIPPAISDYREQIERLAEECRENTRAAGEWLEMRAQEILRIFRERNEHDLAELKADLLTRRPVEITVRFSSVPSVAELHRVLETLRQQGVAFEQTETNNPKHQ